MKQHVETITNLLLGAAYADKRLEGAEVTRIRSLLATLLEGEVPEQLQAQIQGFQPAAFRVQEAAARLVDLDAADKRRLLELVASVNDADEELAVAEDDYLRKLEAYDRAVDVVAEELEEYDALLIVGGSGPIVDLANNERVHELILAFLRAGKPIAAECYGVVGTKGAGKLARFRVRGRTTRGIEVSGDERGVSIALHVVVEHGLNLAEVAATVRNRVAYEVGRMTGLEIAAVEVHIEAVKVSA